jgi:hypothetical protein
MLTSSYDGSMTVARNSKADVQLFDDLKPLMFGAWQKSSPRGTEGTYELRKAQQETE